MAHNAICFICLYVNKKVIGLYVRAILLSISLFFLFSCAKNNGHKENTPIDKESNINIKDHVQKTVPYIEEDFLDQKKGNYKPLNTMTLGFYNAPLKMYFDPQGATSEFELQLSHLLYLTLTVLDPITGEAQPSLAKMWRVVDAKNGGLTYTITLRDSTWSDFLGGGQITASQVKKSLLRILMKRYTFSRLIALSVKGAYAVYNMTDNASDTALEDALSRVQIRVLSRKKIAITTTSNSVNILSMLANPAFVILPFQLGDAENIKDSVYRRNDEERIPREFFLPIQSIIEQKNATPISYGGPYVLVSVEETEISEKNDSNTAILTFIRNKSFFGNQWIKKIQLIQLSGVYSAADTKTQQYDFIRIPLIPFIGGEIQGKEDTKKNMVPAPFYLRFSHLLAASIKDGSSIIDALKNTPLYSNILKSKSQTVSLTKINRKALQFFFMMLIKDMKKDIPNYISQFIQPAKNIYLPFMVSPISNNKSSNLNNEVSSKEEKILKKLYSNDLYQQIIACFKQGKSGIKIAVRLEKEGSNGLHVNKEIYAFFKHYFFAYFTTIGIAVEHTSIDDADIVFTVLSPYSNEVEGMLAAIIGHSYNEKVNTIYAKIEELVNITSLEEYNKKLEEINEEAYNSRIVFPIVYIPDVFYMSATDEWWSRPHQSWMSLVGW